MKVRTNYWMLEHKQMLHLTCPHCDNKFRALVAGGAQVVKCVLDDTPGCGKEFVVRLPLSVMIDVKCIAIVED
jgi:hypothetical protein